MRASIYDDCHVFCYCNRYFRASAKTNRDALCNAKTPGEVGEGAADRGPHQVRASPPSFPPPYLREGAVGGKAGDGPASACRLGGSDARLQRCAAASAAENGRGLHARALVRAAPVFGRILPLPSHSHASFRVYGQSFLLLVFDGSAPIAPHGRLRSVVALPQLLGSLLGGEGREEDGRK